MSASQTLSQACRVAIVIPARAGSSRFPNKPMAKLVGKSVLERTWQIAQSVKATSHHSLDIKIATDSTEVAAFAQGFGASVVLTSADCTNGTERVWDALKGSSASKFQGAINLQGDAVLTPPWVVASVIDRLVALDCQDASLVTPSSWLTWGQMAEFTKGKLDGRSSGTLVVGDLKGHALYFSKGYIPNLRGKSVEDYCKSPNSTERSPFRRHIGLYGYTIPALERYCKLSPTPLELCEQLEQLRALENGIPIHLVDVDYRGRTHWSIDHPEDLEIAERIIRREGELI